MYRLEHVGIAIRDVDTAIDRFYDLLGERPYKAESVPQQSVKTHFLDAESTKLELLDALDEDSPVARFLDRHGEGLHHLAFEVDDAEAAMARVQEEGFDVLSESPQSGADDKDIFFIHPKQTHGVLVEFCESVEPAWSPRPVPHRSGTVSVFERGRRDRPSVVFLHGAAGTTRAETGPLMRKLEPAFHVVGVNLSGHGTSTFPNEPLSLDLFAEDVLAALDALELDSAHLFGFSLGGGVALRVAHDHPDRVQRLALFQTNVDWTDAQVRAMRNRLDLDTLRERNPAQAKRLAGVHEHPSRLFRELRRFVSSLPETSDTLMQAVSDIRAPTLVGTVDRDPLFGPDVAERLARTLPKARLAVLPGNRHRLRDAPLELASLLTGHFKGETRTLAS